MRLLYLCSDFGVPPDGIKGASVHLRAITRELAAIGHEVTLLSPREGPGDGHPAVPLLSPGLPRTDKAIRGLKQWLTDRGFDDAYARELRALLYNTRAADEALAALAARPPGAVIERLSLFGHTGMDLADALGIPLILEVNAPLALEAKEYRSLQLASLAEEIEARVMARADAILCVSSPLAAWLKQRDIPAAKLHVVPNGVDADAFGRHFDATRQRSMLGLGDAFVVGFAGSLKAWHGVDVLLEAFAHVLASDENSRLLIVGTGPMEDKLRHLAGTMNIDHAVVFTGAVAHDQIPAVLSAMDVAVAPFRAADHFYFSPIKVFEYMAAGCCVIASRIGQIAEVITDGENGLLCTPDDPAALAARLDQARRQPEERRQLGVRAQQTALNAYTWRHTAQRVDAIVRSLVLRSERTVVPAAVSDA